MLRTVSGGFVIACSLVPLVLVVLTVGRVRGADLHSSTTRFSYEFTLAMVLMFAGLLGEGIAIITRTRTLGTIAGLVFVVGIGVQFLAQRRFDRPRE